MENSVMEKKKRWVVPQGDFKFSERQRKFVANIMISGRITEGKYVGLFEKAWAEYIGTKYCVATSNGTAALMLVYAALASGHNRLVVPATTYAATANAGYLLGYKLLFKDPVKNGFVIDDLGLNNACWPSDVVVPVHLFGYPCDMFGIMDAAADNGFAVVEDCAQSPGTLVQGRKVGGFGLAGVFSFYMTHNIQGGEMGCITTNSQELYEALLLLKNNGRDMSDRFRFRHVSIGFNAKTTEFSAALALDQALRADQIKRARWQNAVELVGNIKNDGVVLPELDEDFSIMALPIGVGNESKRKKFIDALSKAGVETRLMFPCLLNQPAYAGFNTGLGYERANELEQKWFYVPIHQYLDSAKIGLIAKTINGVK